MPQYYNPNRSRNIFDPKSKELFDIKMKSLELEKQYLENKLQAK